MYQVAVGGQEGGVWLLLLLHRLMAMCACSSSVQPLGNVGRGAQVSQQGAQVSSSSAATCLRPSHLKDHVVFLLSLLLSLFLLSLFVVVVLRLYGGKGIREQEHP